MKNHYLIVLEKEMARLWIGNQSIAVLKLGKDKFAIVDGPKSVRAKGFQLLRITKKLPDRAGADRFWRNMSPLGVKISSNYKVEANTR
jgi:hypothetical protein